MQHDIMTCMPRQKRPGCFLDHRPGHTISVVLSGELGSSTSSMLTSTPSASSSPVTVSSSSTPDDPSTSVPVLVVPFPGILSASCGVRTKDCGGGVRGGIGAHTGYNDAGMMDVVGTASGLGARSGAVGVVDGSGYGETGLGEAVYLYPYVSGGEPGLLPGTGVWSAWA